MNPSPISQTPVDPAAFITNPGNQGAPLYVGMAPCIAYFDVRAVSSTRHDIPQWNFGDGADHRVDPTTGGTVDANSALTAQCVGHWYLSPGTHTGFCKVNSKTYPFTVKIVPDTRTQVTITAANAAQFYNYAIQNNINITIADNVTVHLAGTVHLGHNVVIAGAGPGSTLDLAPGLLAFAGTCGTTADVLICNLNINGSTAQVARLRGKRICILDCRLGDLNRGIEVEPDASAANTDCVLIQGNKQVGSMISQGMYIGGGTRIIELFNTLTSSTDESPNRADGTVGLLGWTIEYCDYSQPAYAKASVTRRCGTDGTIAHSKISKSDLSINVGSADPATEAIIRITNTVVRGCICDFSDTAGSVKILPGVIGITFDNNTIMRSNGPAFTVQFSNPTVPTKDVVLTNNTVKGTNVRLLFQPVPSSILTQFGNTINGVAA